MKFSTAIAAALVLTSLVLSPGIAAARGGAHGQVARQSGSGRTAQGTGHVHPAWWGRGYGRYGRGWCYWHPYACYRNSRS